VILTKFQLTFGRTTKLQLTTSYWSTRARVPAP
jgi:hypothetical protein